MKYQIPYYVELGCIAVAKKIEEAHRATDKAYVKEMNLSGKALALGLMAEWAFACQYRLLFNPKPVEDLNDGGKDFVMLGRKINVKTTDRPDGNMLVRESDKPLKADIYVFSYAIRDDEGVVVELVGWCYKEQVEKAKVISKNMPLEPAMLVAPKDLLPMESLQRECYKKLYR